MTIQEYYAEEGLLPEKPSNVDDADWESYLILTWCGNSLNEMSGLLRHYAHKSFYDGVDPYPVNFETLLEILNYLDRAQLVLIYLYQKCIVLQKKLESKEVTDDG